MAPQAACAVRAGGRTGRAVSAPVRRLSDRPIHLEERMTPDRCVALGLAAITMLGCATTPPPAPVAVAPLTDPQERLAALEACELEYPAKDRETRLVADKLMVATLPILGIGALFAPALTAGARAGYERCLRERGYTVELPTAKP